MKLIDDVAAAYKESGEYIKAAAARKASKSIAGVAAPIAVAQELLVLEGVGKGTVEKIHAFLAARARDPSGGLAGAAAAAAAAAGKDADFEWVEASERDVLVDLIKRGELALESLRGWRSDISAADVA